MPYNDWGPTDWMIKGNQYMVSAPNFPKFVEDKPLRGS